jgi:hypothetical protein
MNGILAQTAALAAHARARLLEARLGGDEAYWERHSTLKYVRTLTFKTRKRGVFRSAEVALASSPSGWMSALPAGADVSLVSLGASGPLEAHIASAFVGGTQEGIAVLREDGGDLWVPTWEVVSQYPDTKIWSVTYLATASHGVEVAGKTLDRARTDLAAALNEVTAFATTETSLSGWRKTFDKARDALDASAPSPLYHPDILPPDGYSLPARQLIAASVGAFVFGGMGSWNDCGFEDREVQAHYERLTKKLYVAVMDALVSSINGGLLPCSSN